MKIVIRIHGKIKIKEEIENTLHRLRIHKKYSCSLIRETKENLGMIKKVRDFTAYGTIDDKTLKELIEIRGQLIDKKKAKPKSEEVVKGLNEGKKLQDFNLKPFFRLHPPRKGIDSKIHFPKGVLGDHKEKINDLIKRML